MRYFQACIFGIAFSVIATGTLAQSGDILPPPWDGSYEAVLMTDRGHTMGFVRNGNDADNELGGTEHNDAFRGVGGDDLLIGYQGFDTYTFGEGDGYDTIIDLSPEGNRIKFLPDVPEIAVTFVETPGVNGEVDRLITYGTGNAIRIVGWSRLSEAQRSLWTVEYLAPPATRATDVRDVPDRSARRERGWAERFGFPLYMYLAGLIFGISMLALWRAFLR